MGLVDAFDALTSARPYHQAKTVEEAFLVIEIQRGTQFEGSLIDALHALATTDELAHVAGHIFEGRRRGEMRLPSAESESDRGLAQRPAAHGATVRSARPSPSNADNAANPNTLEFRDDEGRALLQYAKLEVTDASGRRILATLRRTSGETRFIIHDVEAKYPIVIDPIFVPTPIGDWQAESNQANAWMGYRVENGRTLKFTSQGFEEE